MENHKIKNSLTEKYAELCSAWGVSIPKETEVNYIVKESLATFVSKCKNPAIWGNGNHTKMIMADFVYELRRVKYIVDNISEENKCEGYYLIGENQIKSSGIDGIIISSFRYRNQIKKKLKEEYGDIKYLDLYDALEACGIKCEMEYYALNHPYEHYLRINELKRRMEDHMCDRKTAAELVRAFLVLKDFRMAESCADTYGFLFSETESAKKVALIHEMYEMELEAAAQINKNNVLLFCVDALRRSDMNQGLMPKVQKYIDEKMVWFENAYSVSTSTYESLIPAYSENFDLRTKYFDDNLIKSDGCRFINEAQKQNRKVYFYTDTIPFIDNPIIEVKKELQTASQKIWDFILDAADEDNGLFYIHFLYESHFSFSNPYTKAPLTANGTNIFFDYLEKNGGEIRADYMMQHRDALRYLDDLTEPFLRKMNVSLVLFSDHGISVVEKERTLEDVERTHFTCGNPNIQIPFAYKAPYSEKKTVSSVFSLGDINTVVLALLQKKQVEIPERKYVKVQRSRIYNPDYISLYKKIGFEMGGAAFEAFIFENRYKLVVYENRQMELYNPDDILSENGELKNSFYEIVRAEITVF